MTQQFYVSGKPVRMTSRAPNIFAFCGFMAAAVAAKRGGRPMQYVPECAEFMVEVVGRRLSISDALPSDYDWTLTSAIDSAHQMMEYDS